MSVQLEILVSEMSRYALTFVKLYSVIRALFLCALALSLYTNALDEESDSVHLSRYLYVSVLSGRLHDSIRRLHQFGDGD